MIVGMPSDTQVNNIRKRPVCGVLATAVACGVTFQQAWDYYSFKAPKKWKGGLEEYKIIDGIKSFGGNVKKISLFTDEEFSQFRWKAINKLSAYLWVTDPQGVYVVFTRNHAQVVQGNTIIDQSGRNRTQHYWARRRRVNAVYKILNPKVNSDNQLENWNIQEDVLIMSNKNSKQNRAREIVPAKIAAGLSRKQILSELMEELQTTHGAASTFYHIVKKEMEANPVPSNTEAEEEQNDA